ncbi:hypothetical protein CMUS01_11548 [Colletotrichum musicola]|uniref:Uncharacterized protein n=1 Tax=Colletotrichum musicola TaxID=2175873 RepID=A0A8H6JWH5_9PEZI|nr:hypothetical protein CMUS01_11548 [Colletotrichum musicola]
MSRTFTKTLTLYTLRTPMANTPSPAATNCCPDTDRRDPDYVRFTTMVADLASEMPSSTLTNRSPDIVRRVSSTSFLSHQLPPTCIAAANDRAVPDACRPSCGATSQQHATMPPHTRPAAEQTTSPPQLVASKNDALIPDAAY